MLLIKSKTTQVVPFRGCFRENPSGKLATVKSHCVDYFLKMTRTIFHPKTLIVLAGVSCEERGGRIGKTGLEGRYPGLVWTHLNVN